MITILELIVAHRNTYLLKDAACCCVLKATRKKGENILFSTENFRQINLLVMESFRQGEAENFRQ